MSRPAEIQELMEFHRPYWEEMKSDYGVGPGRQAGKVTKTPRFEDSLRSLCEQGYTLTDIGCSIGVTRERVRQWCVEFEIQHIGKTYTKRMWDGVTGKFVACTSAEYHAAERVVEKQRRCTRRLKNRQRRRAQHKAALIFLVLQLGRRPTLGETCEHIGVCWPEVARFWVRGPRPTGRYATASTRLYRSVGLEPYRQGEHR
jgi:hypothetical protein